MGRRDDFVQWISSGALSGNRARAMGLYVAQNRHELLDGAPPPFAAALNDIELKYYLVMDDLAGPSVLNDALSNARGIAPAQAGLTVNSDGGEIIDPIV